VARIGPAQPAEARRRPLAGGAADAWRRRGTDSAQLYRFSKQRNKATPRRRTGAQRLVEQRDPRAARSDGTRARRARIARRGPPPQSRQRRPGIRPGGLGRPGPGRAVVKMARRLGVEPEGSKRAALEPSPAACPPVMGPVMPPGP
jgi:hypothetical protein